MVMPEKLGQEMQRHHGTRNQWDDRFTQLCERLEVRKDNHDQIILFIAYQYDFEWLEKCESDSSFLWETLDEARRVSHIRPKESA